MKSGWKFRTNWSWKCWAFGPELIWSASRFNGEAWGHTFDSGVMLIIGPLCLYIVHQTHKPGTIYRDIDALKALAKAITTKGA